MKKKEINLIIDGNLLARKSFYKFQNLSAKLRNRDLLSLSKSLIPDSESSEKENDEKKEFISDNSGREISIKTSGKIDKKLKEISSRESSTEINTGVLYGMLRSILLAYEKFNVKNIIICYDPLPAMSDQFRYKIVAKGGKSLPYKNRKKDPKIEALFLSSLLLSQAFFYKAGITQTISTKFEADDLLHYYTHKLYKDDQCLILTNDHDLFQILVPNRVKILKIGSDYSIYSASDFKKEYNIPSNKYRLVLAIGGCSTDNVSGIPGISEKSAISLIKEFNSIENMIKSYKSSSIPLRLKTALEKEEAVGFSNLFLSLKLVSLYGLYSYLESDLLIKKSNKSPEIRYNSAVSLLELLNFKSFLTKSSLSSIESLISNS